MELKNVKGSKDYLANEQIIRNKIIDTLKENFELYGYLPIETTTICYYDLLSSKYSGGSEILKEVYKLTDQGKRNLALRYDLTVPFAKIISMNKNLSLPFKRYEIGKVYRDGPVKLGRDREFYQCDVDVCGIDNQYAEIELFQLAINCYKKLGIDIEIRWNNRKLLSGLIEESKIDKSLISNTILIVDKLDKLPLQEVKKELENLNISKSSIDKLFNYFKMDLNKLEKEISKESNENLKIGLSEVKELQEYIEKLGLTSCVFTPYLARGLEIYTKTVWEIYDKDKRVTCAIGAGGRYDNIITNFINDGNKYPAVGMSFGLVPIYEIISKEISTEKSLYDLYIIPMNTEIESLSLADKLRQNKIKVIIEMNNKKLKKALEYANKNKIPYVIIIGEDEIKSKKIKIKDMFNKKEIESSLLDIEKITQILTKEK